MVNSGLSDIGQDKVTNMPGSSSESDERNERCAEPSGDEQQGEDLIPAENKECDHDEGQPGPSKSNEEKETNNRADEKSADVSCSKSEEILLAAACSESLPSSDSNKENVDSNVLNQSVDFDLSEYTLTGEVGSTANPDLIPLPQLLKIHVKQLVSGFEFGEATKRRAQENMKAARDKTRNDRKSGELSAPEAPQSSDKADDTLPCPSQSGSETEHKTPHSRKRQRLGESKNNLIISDKKDCLCKLSRRVPDTLQQYPDCTEVWTYMIFKEEASLKLRNPRLFNDFKSVTPRMRAILLDWLMEVASVYHLRRVTYYLSVDYFDRFLSIRPDIPKSLLQLVGITCLYIAAKVEEIYPPNLAEFSYVCDGACKSKDMVSCELLILNSLGWEVVLTTPTDWLNLYMQLHCKKGDVFECAMNKDFNRDFMFPQYSSYQFTRASQLMDLISLDPGFLKFGYSVVAAAAMYYMYGEEVALSVSGLTLEQLGPCTSYMEVFYVTIKDSPDPRLESCLGGPHPEDERVSHVVYQRKKSGPHNENYSFQTHVASMEYFEKATIFRLTCLNRQQKETILNIIGEENSEVVNEEESESNLTYSTQENNDEAEEISSVSKSSPEDNLANSLIDDITSLEDFTKSVEEGRNEESAADDNLMSLDEIFELILSQDDDKQSTNSE